MNHKKNTLIDIEKLAYAPKLAEQLFEPIQHLPWAMLLRSSAENHQDSRFDVLVAKPLVTLTTFAGQTTIETAQQHMVSHDDPFVLTAQYQEQYLPDLTCDLDVPFVGGALGYWAYDLGRRIETLPATAEHDIAMPDMAVGLYEWAVIVDHQTQSAFVVGQNVLDAWTWLKNQPRPPAASLTVGPWQSNMTQAQYAKKFNAVQAYLRSGDCYQVNLTQRFCAPYQGSEWHIYTQLEQANRAPFSAFLRLPQGAIISLSPERFLRVNDRHIDTKPIKGTRPRSEDANQDKKLANELAHSAKDQAENLMIVDLLRNDVGKVAMPGSVRVPHLFAVESFPAVHHLVSTITAQLDERYTMAQLLRACFPGGSITGAPKIRAMQIIEELEPHRRSLYCGSIGYISRHGRMDTSITIRTLIACQNLLYVWAGGGLVADSQVDDEYQETLDKLSRILPLLG
ncbi:aminodeoxychorismate synthase component I [Vibrio zhugei]|uniref:aminodeoxychorismate synthase n=1 Tax=Vibrio zhugei TaxID=2479546 RepID=A0ABV7C7K9_9VIBR|nr:aminodeoxychorismate synthase component I [Vibrio zhugei]